MSEQAGSLAHQPSPYRLLCENNGGHKAADRHGRPAPGERERSRWLGVDHMRLGLERDQCILGP